MNFYPINANFIQETKELKKNYQHILSIELQFPVSKNFFKFKDSYYPIKIKFTIDALEQNNATFGSFNPNNLTIQINYYYYQYLNPEEKFNLIRHELAHYLCYILKGPLGTSHDSYFRDVCQSYGFGPEIYSAKVDLKIIDKIKSQQKNSVKAEKLMALAHNNNSWEEAQSALLKAKMLMDQNTLTNHEQDYVALELHSGKRLDIKIQTIAQLLENFSCKTLFLTTPGCFTLEAICKKSEMQNIFELFSFFYKQIDLWYSESKKHNKGLHRSSFYRGLQKGLEQKIGKQDNITFEYQKSLIKVDLENLNKHFELLYPRVGRSSSKAKNDSYSFSQGVMLGKRIELKNKIKQTLRFLT